MEPIACARNPASRYIHFHYFLHHNGPWGVLPSLRHRFNVLVLCTVNYILVAWSRLSPDPWLAASLHRRSSSGDALVYRKLEVEELTSQSFDSHVRWTEKYYFCQSVYQRTNQENDLFAFLLGIHMCMEILPSQQLIIGTRSQIGFYLLYCDVNSFSL